MQKNKTKYDQIIKNIDKLTFDSLLDIMIPESADGKIPSAKEVEFKKYLIETNPSFLKEIGSKLKTLNKLSKDIYKFNFVDLPKQNKEKIFQKLLKFEGIFMKQFSHQFMDCYYTNDRVLEGLGLEVKPPFPDGNIVESGDFRLLEPVIQRGNFMR